LDKRFPGLRTRYEQVFGERYSAPARNHTRLEKVFAESCQEYGMAAKMPVFRPQKRLREAEDQPKLF